MDPVRRRNVEEAGARRALQRLRDPRAALRDPMLVERILDRHGVRPSLRPVLDAPCGSGRLRSVLERRGMRWVGLDDSTTLLAENARASDAALVRADVAHIPFRDDSFDVVVCCRLLHHMSNETDLERVVRELVRVSQRMVIASFWDATSWHALRRRVGTRRGESALSRHAVSRRAVRRVFRDAGAEVVDFEHSLRFVSQQAFVVALKKCPVDERARGMRALSRDLLRSIELESAPGSLGGA